MYKCTSVYTVIGPFTQCSMKIYEHLYCSQEQHIHYAFIKQNKTRAWQNFDQYWKLHRCIHKEVFDIGE